MLDSHQRQVNYLEWYPKVAPVLEIRLSFSLGTTATRENPRPDISDSIALLL